MDILTEKINKNFNNEFANLKLFDVVYDKGLNVCSITFLYPFNMDELKVEEREKLTNFVREFLSLNAKVRIKLKKSFLDKNLIIKEINNYFEGEHKGIFPYIFQENISIESNDFDIKIFIGINKDILSMLDEGKIKTNIKKFLERRFIANFDIEFGEIEEQLPSEIEFEDIPPTQTSVPRYEVEVLGKFVGGEISPRPEYIQNNTKPKASVILAGIITNISNKTFKIKKGKREGQDKYLYNFNLSDENTIDCVYFCPKTYEKRMEKLDEGMYMLCLGDLKTGLSGKLTYYIKSMQYANKKSSLKLINTQTVKSETHKQVVFPEPLPSSSQANLFEDKPKYNDFILNNDIVVFDVETTGLEYETCEIIELGAVKIEKGHIKERFSSYVKPKSEIPEEITKLTGITNEMVAHAPRIEDVITDFYNYTRGCVISGYNIVGFDMNFIKKAASLVGLKFDNNLMDAFIMARQANLRAPNYKLGTVVKVLGLTLTDAHRAYNDAHATAQVLLELSKVKNK